VTWCATGPAAFLPLHAAGIYDDLGSTQKIFHHVVSSYVPTLRMLVRQPPPYFSGTSRGLLVISQPAAPGNLPLPGVKQEVERIREAYHGRNPPTVLEDDNATADAIMHSLESHSWAHFACHGSQDREDPIRSGFLLYNDVLQLSRLMEKSFSHLELAFLSACETATGDARAPEEALHIAAGMLMAGFTSVLATMWSIRDEDAPLIAQEVYTRLLKGDRPDASRAAYALDEATKVLRETIGEGQFVRWIPFVHIGA
jgi:CHAT domain-containing protein